MIEKVKREKNTITLPDSIVSELGDVEYFDIVADAERIVLTPAQDAPEKKITFADLCGKFEAWMSDDFDAPMEEFAEYM